MTEDTASVPFEESVARLAAESPELRDALDESEPSYQVARQLIRRRHELGLSQAEVARRMGTTQSVVSRVERMDTTPNLSTVYALAAALESRVVLEFVPRTAAPTQLDFPADPLQHMDAVAHELQESLEALRRLFSYPDDTNLAEIAEMLEVTPDVVRALSDSGVIMINTKSMRHDQTDPATR